MADVDDIKGQHSQHDELMETIRTHDDIADVDRESLVAFDEHLAYEDNTIGTRVSYLTTLKLLAIHTDEPMSELDRDGAERLLKSYAAKKDLAATTRDKNVAIFSSFISSVLGKDWGPELPKPDVESTKTVTSDDIYTEEEFYDMLDAADHPRDKAIIAMFWDLGARPGAIGSLRVGDVEIRSDHAIVSWNEDAEGLKGASGEKPVTVAKPYLANWLAAHPRPEEPDAPLWHKLRDHREGDALSHTSIDYVVRNAAKDAGLEVERVLGTFRHTSAARAKLDPDHNDEHIMFKHDWRTRDMLDVYGEFDDQEMVDSILESKGVVTSDDDEDVGPDNCPQCGVVLEGGESFCPGCGQAITTTAAETFDDVEERALDDLTSLSGDDAEAVREFFDAIREDPSVLDRLHSDSS